MSKCTECGAVRSDESTCQDDFYQMLYWENETPGHGAVHHLMVLCYHLQHPSLYSQDGLAAARRLLVDFVVKGLEPEQVRKQNRDKVDSGKRAWKIKANAGSAGSYPHPVAWRITAADVVGRGANHYLDSVREWAQSIYDELEKRAGQYE